jgi:hypothetical protein
MQSSLFWRQRFIQAAFTAVVCSATASAADVAPARSNWVVAQTASAAYAFYGLGAGKTHADIARDVYRFDLSSQRWRALGAIPVPAGRLAGAAVRVDAQIYLLGGYTVAADGAEASSPEVLRFDPSTVKFHVESKMPTPVDDAVALNWRDRWIVLISGWHDTGNVALVQLYDTQSKEWRTATPWPGTPVFGHAGAMHGDVAVVCDGVSAVKNAAGKNQFALSQQCWRGDFALNTPGIVTWTALQAHPGKPRYRSGAIAARGGANNLCVDSFAKANKFELQVLPRQNKLLFAGGSTRAYNFNGIGYDGKPAEPSAAVYSIDLQTNRWRVEKPLPEAGMDFRGMVDDGKRYLLFGGMRAGQVVSNGVIGYSD